MTAVDELAVVQDVAPELGEASLTLARRFSAGATLWCASPEWPWHARHVAVEFVHPVIVGKPALPAATMAGHDMAGALRRLARPGDVLLTVGSGDEPVTDDLLRRAEAWGLTRIAIGAGASPSSAGVEHKVWLESVEAPIAARCGTLVLCYHLLWELTHVVLEHPGLLAPEAECEEEICITCRDQGEVGEVEALGADGQLEAVVSGRRESVDGTLVEAVVAGDLVLVHAGVALSVIPVGNGDRGAGR